MNGEANRERVNREEDCVVFDYRARKWKEPISPLWSQSTGTVAAVASSLKSLISTPLPGKS